MYGYNGQYPGPLIRAPRGATIVVNFSNDIEMPTTVHWHGLRLDNRFDGVPDVTQAPAVQPGESFRYEVHFRDSGIYWYHPHVREDIQQDLGLYGNMMVTPPNPDYYGPAHREEVVILDDILMDDNGLMHFGASTPTHALMGRFGNVMLVNGATDYSLSTSEARRGRALLPDQRRQLADVQRHLRQRQGRRWWPPTSANSSASSGCRASSSPRPSATSSTCCSTSPARC